MTAQSSPPRTFLVSTARIKGVWVGLAMLAWMLVVAAAAVAINLLLPNELARQATGVLITMSAIAYLPLLVLFLRPKKILLSLTQDQLSVDGGRGGVYPLADARFGVWTISYSGVTVGTALHFRNGQRSYVVGGQDHRVSPSAQIDRPPVQKVDAWMPAAEFDDFTAGISSLTVAPSAEASHRTRPSPVRCMLIPNRASARATFSTMLPWIVSTVLICVLSATFAALDLLNRYENQIAFAVLVVGLILGSIVVIAVRAARVPQPALAIETDEREVRLLDPRSNERIATAPRLQVTATPANHTYGGRSTYMLPLLVVVIPGSKPISLGIHDFRFSWCGKVPHQSAPTYVVGGADWLSLVDSFGLRQFLKVGTW